MLIEVLIRLYTLTLVCPVTFQENSDELLIEFSATISAFPTGTHLYTWVEWGKQGKETCPKSHADSGIRTRDLMTASQLSCESCSRLVLDRTWFHHFMPNLLFPIST